MSSLDPFAEFESERTIIKPKPRHGTVEISHDSQLSAPKSNNEESMQLDIVGMSMLNPLVSAASSLLGLIFNLRNARQTPPISDLRSCLYQAIQRFEADALKMGLPNGHVMAARYVLCTAIDESVANTHWGAQAAWNKQSLLVEFHNETWGGEKVFQLLAKLSQDVSGNRNLLELMYCVLALGFQGRYRVIENGVSQLNSIRQRLADLINKDQPPVDQDLSPNWRSQVGGIPKATEVLPIWIFTVLAGLMLALIYLAFRLTLNYKSDGTYSAVSDLRVSNAQVNVAQPVPAKNPRLSGFLQQEIKEGLIAVLEESDRSIIRLRGDSFFGSGKADPTALTMPVLHRIGAALAQVRGEVLVVGHSDNQPIRSVRFPSNWHLSTARAESVSAALVNDVNKMRLRSMGKADAEPIMPNDTAEGRSQNRRVDIILIPEQGTNLRVADGVKK
jgi:type VI secretion system protein ImpK